MTRRFTPRASRTTRTVVAGVTWSFAGAMLVAWAVVWLAAASPAEAVVSGLAGAAVALVAWRAGFSRIVRANLARLARMSERACVFGFQAPKSYLVMGAMIALGITLRHSALPRTWLAVVYAGIGGALFLASIGYYRAARALPLEVTR